MPPPIRDGPPTEDDAEFLADDTLSGKHSRSLYGPANDIALFVNNLLPGFAPGTIQAVVSAQGAPG